MCRRLAARARSLWSLASSCPYIAFQDGRHWDGAPQLEPKLELSVLALRSALTFAAYPLTELEQGEGSVVQELAQPAFVFTVTGTEGIEVPATVAMSPATLSTLTAGSIALDKGAGPPTNILRAVFQPRGPGIHRTRLLLNSPNDVRVLDVEYNAQASGQTATLQLCCPVRQSLVQEVRLPCCPGLRMHACPQSEDGAHVNGWSVASGGNLSASRICPLLERRCTPVTCIR